MSEFLDGVLLVFVSFVILYIAVVVGFGIGRWHR